MATWNYLANYHPLARESLVRIFPILRCEEWEHRFKQTNDAGRTITFIMCRRGRRDTASQVARRLSDQDIMRRYRMTVRCVLGVLCIIVLIIERA